MRVGEVQKTFDAMKLMFNGMSVSLSVHKELYKTVGVPVMIYGADTWGKNKIKAVFANIRLLETPLFQQG